MATPTQIVRGLSTARFVEIFAVSPRPFREELLRRSGVKAKGNAFQLASTSKNQVRVEKLHAAIVGGLDLGDQVLEELVRGFLYTKRTLLIDALDHLQVTHKEGLTDADLDFIPKLEPERAAALEAFLSSRHPPEDVLLYLAFMNVPGH